ncbi:MAG: prepilin-type N-terminal cleavage/methylation domain-containing protein [Patescibacteria group bacterium]
MNKLIKKRGFTLIELVIYIALFGVLMTGASVATYQLLEGGTRNETAVAIQEEGSFLNRKINWALTGATIAIVSPDGSVLTINKIPGADFAVADNPLLIYSSAGALMIKRGNAAAVQLNNSTYPVHGFAAQSTVESNGETGIYIKFDIAGVPFVFKRYLR